MKHESTIQLCRNRAMAQLRMAEFIASRCETFDCICAHETDWHEADWSRYPSLHVYDLAKAVELFGPDGWEPCSYSAKNVQKLVDGVLVSAKRNSAGYIVPPTLP